MAAKSGSLSINSENIFPIIKKWLYSDHDIFYRELISNGCDAITKLKKLELMGEYTKPEDLEYKIQVTVDQNAKTIMVEDNGIGMTAEEVEEYINQIAFSGAQDFLEKYKDKANEDQIIGHFGLGFYSAFMVADRVTIDTLSYKEDAEPVHWESEGGTEFSMDTGDKEQNGTRITLYLNEDSHEFCNEYRAREVIQKYCAFMPVEIFLANASGEPEYETIEKDELTDKDKVIETIIEEAKTEEKENEDGTKETVEVSPRKEKYKIAKRPVALNDIHPLWNKHPNECSEEEYREFYRKVFMDYKEPLFWIHLNMDYPFNLKGILYFPKINMEYESIEGTIKLYNNQVFIADNIKEVIPEFLMLLKGVIDCPDLPLNVSRSALQNDGFVNIIFKNLEGKYLTLKDCGERAKEENHENKIFYVTDEKEQSQYINLFKESGQDAVILPHSIDSPFIGHLEQKHENTKFLRIDADVNDTMKEEVKEDEQEDLKKKEETLSGIFKKALGNDKLEVKVEKLKNESLSSIITVSEETRRMQDMMKMYNMYGMDPSVFGGSGQVLVLNANNHLVQYVLEHEDGENTPKICEQLYDLALLSHGSLTPERMSGFIARTNEMMGLML